MKENVRLAQEAGETWKNEQFFLLEESKQREINQLNFDSEVKKAEADAYAKLTEEQKEEENLTFEEVQAQYFH